MSQLVQSSYNVQVLPISTVYNKFEIFFSRLSKNTVRGYRKNIEEYFMFRCGKQLHELYRDDIEFVVVNGQKEKLMTYHADEYKNYLKKKYPNNNTVRAKLSAVRSLFEYLGTNGFDVNHKIFDLKFIKINPNSYDNIPFYLINEFAEKALKEDYAGEELSVFILLAAQTSVRVDALLRSKLSDIKLHSMHPEKIYVLEVVDKGEVKRTPPIDEVVYNKIMDLTCGYDREDKIFKKLKQDWIVKKIKKIASTFAELKDKNIVTHSLRHTAGTYEMDQTGDIRKVMAQTGHQSVEVAVGVYSRLTVDYSQYAGIRMMREVREDALDNLSKEEILKRLKEINPAAYHGLLVDISNNAK